MGQSPSSIIDGDKQVIDCPENLYIKTISIQRRQKIENGIIINVDCASFTFIDVSDFSWGVVFRELIETRQFEEIGRTYDLTFNWYHFGDKPENNPKTKVRDELLLRLDAIILNFNDRTLFPNMVLNFKITKYDDRVCVTGRWVGNELIRAVVERYNSFLSNTLHYDLKDYSQVVEINNPLPNIPFALNNGLKVLVNSTNEEGENLIVIKYDLLITNQVMRVTKDEYDRMKDSLIFSQ